VVKVVKFFDQSSPHQESYTIKIIIIFIITLILQLHYLHTCQCTFYHLALNSRIYLKYIAFCHPLVVTELLEQIQ